MSKPTDAHDTANPGKIGYGNAGYGTKFRLGDDDDDDDDDDVANIPGADEKIQDWIQAGLWPSPNVSDTSMWTTVDPIDDSLVACLETVNRQVQAEIRNQADVIHQLGSRLSENVRRNEQLMRALRVVQMFAHFPAMPLARSMVNYVLDGTEPQITTR